MSFSISNVNNLRYLYCEADRENIENWEEFKRQLVTDFNKTIEVAFKGKCDAYFDRLLQNILSMLENDFIILDGDQLASYLLFMVADLSLSFRYEILRLSKQGCIDLADKHSLIIKGRNIDTSTMQALMSDPKEEINRRIDAYINERKDRWFKSKNKSREKFLQKIKTQINGSNVNIKSLIDLVSSQVFFKDDWKDWYMGVKSEGTTLEQTNESLNYLNPFIQGLEIYKHNQPTPTFDETHTFNNPCFTRLHTPLKETMEDVLLLLMRWQITHVSNNDHSTKSIREICAATINDISNRHADSFDITIKRKWNSLAFWRDHDPHNTTVLGWNQ